MRDARNGVIGQIGKRPQVMLGNLIGLYQLCQVKMGSCGGDRGYGGLWGRPGDVVLPRAMKPTFARVGVLLYWAASQLPDLVCEPDRQCS